MTVQELYNYAILNSLLDHQVEDVIDSFNVVQKSSNTPIQSNDLSNIDLSNIDLLNKVEWSIEDVLWLFST